MAPPLTIQLFGPMRVLIGESPLPTLRSRKALWLLALMALRHGRPLSREWVASALWPDADASTALANLRPVVSELRRALGDQAFRLRSPVRGTILLDLSGADVDVASFDEAVRQGDVDRLRQAVARYRGPLLEGCSEEWALQERDAREQDCANALRRLGDAALTSHDFQEAIRHFERMILLDPWRDVARRGLMEALARSGEVNAALHAYREFARRLGAEAGTTPDAETSALYERLRRDLRRPTRAVATEEAARPTPNNLRKPLTELVGREDERADVAARLRRSRLVTLTGVGGIGKTRLALAVAADLLTEYAGGVWLVPLDALLDERAVPQAIAAELGVREEPARTLVASIADRLRAGKSLLVLDNCEHVLGAVARLVAALLRERPDLRVLATSREATGIVGEAAWPVPVLAFPEATSLPAGRATRLRVAQGYDSVRLFVERATAVLPGFVLGDDNLAAVVDVCAQVEGIPLAIELAAARVRAMPVAALADRLRERSLDTLAGRGRAAPERQGTLRGALDWSYSLLEDEDRAAFQRLAAFAGGWTLEAAEAVVGRDDVAERLTSLVDKSLVKFDSASGRYGFLETVRQYALERLRAAGEEAAVQRRHREWFLRLAEQAEPELGHKDQEAWAARLSDDLDNLRAAMGFCDGDPAAGLRLVGALTRLWTYRGFYAEGAEAFREALERPDAQAGTAARAKALNGAATVAFSRGERDRARALGEESLALWRALGDEAGASATLCNLGEMATEAQEYGRAIALIGESLAIQRRIGAPGALALSLCIYGVAVKRQGDLTAAREIMSESLALFRGVGDERMATWVMNHLGGIAHEQGDYAASRAWHEQALDRFRTSGYERGAAWALEALARTLIEIDPEASAVPLLEESLAIFRAADQAYGASIVQTVLGQELVRVGELSRARRLLESCAQGFRATANRQNLAAALEHLAAIEDREGDGAAAEALDREALELRRTVSDQKGMAESLERLADRASRRGEPRRAARLGGAADAIRERLSAPIPPSRRRDLAPGRTRAEETLGGEAFAACWAQGRDLDAMAAAHEALAR